MDQTYGSTVNGRMAEWLLVWMLLLLLPSHTPLSMMAHSHISISPCICYNLLVGSDCVGEHAAQVATSGWRAVKAKRMVPVF